MKRNIAPKTVPALLAFACAAACVPAVAEEGEKIYFCQISPAHFAALKASEEVRRRTEEMKVPPPDFQESVPVLSAKTFLEKFHGLPGFLREENKLHPRRAGTNPFLFRIEEHKTFSETRESLIATFVSTPKHWPVMLVSVPVGTCGVFYGDHLCFVRGNVTVHIWGFNWKNFDEEPELLEIARGIDALLCGKAEFLPENSVAFWEIRAARALDGARRERIFRRARERERARIEKNASAEDRAAFRAGTLEIIPPGVPEYDPLDDYREWASSRRARNFFSCPMVGNGAPETDDARIDLGAFLETLRAVAGTEGLEDGFRMTLPPGAGGTSFRVVFKEMEDDDDALAYLLCRTLYSKSDGKLGDFDPDGFDDCRFCVPGSSRLTFRNGRAMLACGNIYAEITVSSGKADRAALIAMALETERRLREWATETKSSAGE